MPRQIAVSGAFDDLHAPALRFLQEASRLGELTVWLWSDEAVRQRTGQPPKFPLAERLYFLQALRTVARARPQPDPVDVNALPEIDGQRADAWVVEAAEDHIKKAAWCEQHGLAYHVIPTGELAGFPAPPALPDASTGTRKKVIVTGSFDWFHSGHVRFFEEVSTYGDLYVVVGHDANIRLLKGEGHPLLPEAERCYVAASIRFVKQAMISTGHGWLDAEPEIERLKPDIYAVNEDGDKGGKREFCEKRGIEYLVLKRVPAVGLPQRSSTDLRGF